MNRVNIMKIGRQALTICLLALLVVLPLCNAPIFGSFSVPEYKDEFGYVADFADVLRADTINQINASNSALTEACGAELFVVTVDFLNGANIADYSFRLFNQWKIGSADSNNGLLLLLAIGEDDYYALQGQGLEEQFSAGLLDEYLYDYLEADFARGDYDAGVRKFFSAALARLERIYGVNVGGASGSTAPGIVGNDRGSSAYAPPTPVDRPPGRTTFNWGPIVFLVFIVALVFILFSRLPRYPRAYRPPLFRRPRMIYRPIIFGGFRRPRMHYRPPVGRPAPRPARHPMPRPGGGSGGGVGRIGGGGVSRGGGAGRSGGGGFSSGAGRSSGGGSFGGGAGRSSGGGFSGGGRSGGGGMSRGGGAGRR